MQGLFNNNYKILISGSYNAFNEGWNGAGVYMCSGNYVSETYKLPIYIGSSVDLQDRIENDHISTLNQNKHPHNPPLQNSWNKHSEKEGFVWWLLEICESEKTLEREQVYLDLYKPFVDEFGGFNISYFAESGIKGRKMSESSKIKMRIAQQKRVARSDYIHPMTGKGYLLTGKKRSKKTKQKMSISKRGQKISDETKKKLSDINKGHWTGDKNPNRKNPKIGENNPNYGKPKSEETKRKISISKRKYHEINENSRCKPVLCIETGIIYKDKKEAGEKLGIKNYSNICNVCLGRTKTCGGFHWKYIN